MMDEDQTTPAQEQSMMLRREEKEAHARGWKRNLLVLVALLLVLAYLLLR